MGRNINLGGFVFYDSYRLQDRWQSYAEFCTNVRAVLFGFVFSTRWYSADTKLVA